MGKAKLKNEKIDIFSIIQNRVKEEIIPLSHDTIVEFTNHIKSTLGIPVDDNNVVFKQIKETTGRNIKSIYRIEYGSTKWILKLTKEKNEDVMKVGEFIKQIHPELEVNSIVVLSTAVGDFNGIKYEIVPQAEGSSFYDILNQYLNGNISANYLNSCYENLGKNLAHLHLLGHEESLKIRKLKDITSSLQNRDLHGDNIFCNDKGKVSFIDNDRMLYSINSPDSVIDDIVKLFKFNIGLTLDVSKVLGKQYGKMLLPMMASFLKSYGENLNDPKSVVDHDQVIIDLFSLYMSSFESVYKFKSWRGEQISYLEKEDMIIDTLGQAFPEFNFGFDEA